MTVEIPLTRGHVALVDDVDGWLLRLWKWHAHSGRGGIWYAMRQEGSGSRRVSIMMHRQLTDAPNHLDVDHADGNGLNNQRSNLRVCSTRFNMANNRRRAGLSGYRGVQWLPAQNKWRAYISAPDRQLHLGVFSSKEDAARARDLAARGMFGEFAVLNLREDAP